jgi:tRNA threonylcarbamoyladenosine biosynthesis protein TsaB
MKLLALDTASAQCSVALLIDGAMIMRAEATARDHAQLILPMIDAVLAEAGIGLGALDGIAFGRGPGSFTGVRVAASVTQGLAAGSGLAVLPVSDLRALAEQARRCAQAAGVAFGDGLALACMDARMGELYWAAFTCRAGKLGDAAGGERLSRPDALLASLGAGGSTSAAVVLGAGMGLQAYPDLAQQLGIAPAACLPQAEPHAMDVALLAAGDLAAGASWQDAATAQPVYLRDQVVQSPH